MGHVSEGKKSELYKRVEEIEYVLRYYCIEEGEANSIVKPFIEAIGKMGEGHSLISKLMDDIENGKVPGEHWYVTNREVEK